MSSIKLKYAPLKEVIFELHWECVTNNEGVTIDKGFDLAQGIFAAKLQPHFPVHRKLIPDAFPINIIGAPSHQYWKGELQWPVIQHGQGMISVNDNEKGYNWKDNYKPLIINAVNNIIDSYSNSLKFNKVKLQYIDACDVVDLDLTPVEFMNKNLQTQINTEYQEPGDLRGFNIQQSFDLLDSSIMILNISSGINNQNQKTSIVWTTTVEKRGVMTFEDVKIWVDNAHEHTSNMFKAMLKKEYYDSLNG